MKIKTKVKAGGRCGGGSGSPSDNADIWIVKLFTRQRIYLGGAVDASVRRARWSRRVFPTLNKRVPDEDQDQS